MGVKFANNAYGTLNASITNTDTSLTLSSGQGARFPSLGSGEYFYVTLIDTSNNLEIAKCTARSSDVLTITRGQEGTTARAYSVGDRVELRITAQALVDATDIDATLPSQTSQSGKYLSTDGTNASWATVTAPTPAAVSDQANTSTGYFDLPSGTTAQRPGSPNSGMTRVNTSTGMSEVYTGSGWVPQSALVRMSHWRDNTRRTFSSVSSANYEAVTGTITRLRSDTGILVTGTWYGGGGTVNYPSIGQFFRLAGTRHNRGISYTGRDSDGMNSHSIVSFNIYFTPAELSTGTGTIGWAWGWNWPSNSSSAVRPIVGMNANQGDDGRVSGSQEGSALTFWEFLPGIDSYGG